MGQVTHERWEPRHRNYFHLMTNMLSRVNPDPPAVVIKPFDFDFLSTRCPAIIGSPAEVPDRLSAVAEMHSADSNPVYLDMGGQPSAELRDMVELIGAEAIPQLA